MAKWGEGDPRWIVEDRPDATNVNNWHWSEKNASAWSKDKISSLLTSTRLKKDGLGEVKITSVPKCEGEATANNRKGKLIFFYEWVITAEWTATLDDLDAAECNGTIDIPNLSEENEPHELDISITIKSGGSSGEKVKDFLRAEGTKQIQNKLGEYITALREEYAQDLILPTTQKGDGKASQSKTFITSQKPVDNSVNSAISPLNNLGLKSSSEGCKLQVKSLSLSQSFKCRADELYNVFTVPEMLTAFTRGPVKVDVVKGGAFEMFGGNISGTFEELEKGSCIIQKWRFKTWPEGHFSQVRLDFSQKEDTTEISLKQTGIPANDYERTQEGWKNYYWESIKRTFGFGASLM